MESTPLRMRAAPTRPWYLYKALVNRFQTSYELGSTPEEILLEHRHGGYDARDAPRVQSMQLHVAGYHRRREFSIGVSGCSAAADVLRDVVDLFARL